MNTSSSSLSLRIKPETKQALSDLTLRSRRSTSFLVTEAIEQYLEIQNWQIAESMHGIDELDSGNTVSHENFWNALNV